MFNLSKPLLLVLCMVAPQLVAAEDHADEKPVVYLTFDDGPSADSSTEAMLDVLSLYRIKATFFVTGQRARKEPDKIAAILYAGHAIGNHSHTHIALVGETSAGIETEFRKANEAVLAAGGPPLTCYRPPFGLTDSSVRKVGDKMGMAAVKWSVDTRDWQSTTDQLSISASLDSISDGAIVLMHDGPSRRAKTVAALDEWLQQNAHKYQFRALSQCKPYGTSEVFASNDEQEIDLPLEEESIHSLLEKLRSYRFNLHFDGPEQARAASVYGEQLTSVIF